MHLTENDKRHLLAAEGWLELGSHIEANAELENITAAARAHPDVLEVRWEIYSKAKGWVACVDIGNALTSLAPRRVNSWIKLAFSLHVLSRTSEARDTLLSIVEKFPRDPTLCYNLACYACRLGKMDEAAKWLEKAFELGDASELKLAALDDADLAALWKSEDTR